MLEILPIKAFDDNYLWLLKSGSQACVVDPGDGQAVLNYLKQNQLELKAILITHHHQDHTGGIQQLCQHYNVPVYGPRSEKTPAIKHTLCEGEQINILGENFNILEIPGHTLDHIAYYTKTDCSADGPALFCGDTLFAGGCGRVFEGTYEMMYDSLQKLAALSADTQVFCAHEYTLANLAFAAAVSPNDEVLAARIELEQEKRRQDIPTVPSSIQVELHTNPFLRCSDAEILKSVQNKAGTPLSQPEEIFACLRQWKDSF